MPGWYVDGHGIVRRGAKYKGMGKTSLRSELQLSTISLNRPDRIILAVCLSVLLASCANVIPVWVARRGVTYVNETQTGVLDLKRTSPEFEVPPEFERKNFKDADIQSQVDLLADIVSDIQHSEPYQRRKSSLFKIILGQQSNALSLQFKNCQYFMLKPASEPVRPGAEVVETRRGRFVVTENGFYTGCPPTHSK